MYMNRMKSDIWESNYDYEIYKQQYDFINMNLYEFSKTFYVRNKHGAETRHLINNILRIIW